MRPPSSYVWSSGESKKPPIRTVSPAGRTAAPSSARSRRWPPVLEATAVDDFDQPVARAREARPAPSLDELPVRGEAVVEQQRILVKEAPLSLHASSMAPFARGAASTRAASSKVVMGPPRRARSRCGTGTQGHLERVFLPAPSCSKGRPSALLSRSSRAGKGGGAASLGRDDGEGLSGKSARYRLRCCALAPPVGSSRCS